MRLLPIVICWLCIAIPIHADAKPKPRLVVTPLVGDPGNKIGNAVVDALAGKDFVVTSPREAARDLAKLGASGAVDGKAARKLAKKLDAVAVLHGDVAKAGKRRSLHLEITRRGRPTTAFTLEFKTADSPAFRRNVRNEVKKRLEDNTGPASDDDDDDEAKQLAARRAAEDEERRRADDEAAERRRRDDEEVVRRKRADDEAADRDRRARDEARRRDDGSSGRRKRVASGDRDDAELETTGRRRRTRRGAGAAAPLAVVRASAGAVVAQRRLTYDTRAGLTGAQRPPSVMTLAGAGRLDAELYPLAIAGTSGALANLGLAATFEKTLGLSIQIPNQALRAPIDQARYTIGARYRLPVGESSAVTLGVDYVRQHYIADRSGLMAAVLDAPDVDYTAIAPGLSASTPVSSSIALFGALDALLVLETGPIQEPGSYGPATVYGVDAAAGLDIALAKQLNLRVALAYSQISLSFNGKGTQANNRDGDATTVDVSAATDRSIGLTATVGVVY